MSNGDSIRCPAEVAVPVLQILSVAVLSIRANAWGNGSLKYSEIKSDHIHNLPHLLQSYTLENLSYYLDLEVPCYISNLVRLDEPSKEYCKTHYRAAWQSLKEYKTAQQK